MLGDSHWGLRIVEYSVSKGLVIRVMLKRFVWFTLISFLAAFLIHNFVEDLGQRFIYFILFGFIFFGITWTVNETEKAISGCIFGVFVGLIASMMVSLTEEFLVGSDFFLIEPLIILCKWVIPIVVYAVGASLPWKE